MIVAWKEFILINYNEIVNNLTKKIKIISFEEKQYTLSSLSAKNLKEI